MKLGFVYLADGRPGRSMADVRRTATFAEEIGLDSMWFPEHVVFFENYTSKYPYTADGVPGFGKRQGVFDPLGAITVAAGATSRLRFGTGILIVPQRNPLVLAQEVVAVDHATDGRFDFGVGVGWSEEEFVALGVPWSRRGARTDDYLRAMKTLWSDPTCTYEGEFVSFRHVIAEPKPVQAPHPPLWIGGGEAAMRRAATVGDGWYGWNLTPGSVADSVARLDAICERVGRDPATVGRKIGVPHPGPLDDLRPLVEAAAAAGVTEVIAAVARPDVDLRARLEDLAAVVR